MFAGGVVQDDQQPAVGQDAAVERGTVVEVPRDVLGGHAQGAEHAGERVTGLHRRRPLGMAVQVHEELPVGEERGQAVGGVHGQHRLARPGHAGDEDDRLGGAGATKAASHSRTPGAATSAGSWRGTVHGRGSATTGLPVSAPPATGAPVVLRAAVLRAARSASSRSSARASSRTEVVLGRSSPSFSSRRTVLTFRPARSASCSCVSSARRRHVRSSSPKDIPAPGYIPPTPPFSSSACLTTHPPSFLTIETVSRLFKPPFGRHWTESDGADHSGIARKHD